MKLKPIEEEILQTIQKFYPNSWKEIRNTYEEMGSFDDTVKVLEHSNSLAISVYDLMSIINDFQP